jgi:AcrR family transcriptional regulator
MKLQLQFKLNDHLYLRNPEESELGKKIVNYGIELIHKIGFEDFTFKKLATEIGTTEASVYRYFENKHRLLLYIVDWYWSWQEYRVVFHTNNIEDPESKLKKTIHILGEVVEEDSSIEHVNEKLLHEIIMGEGAKTYLTKNVKEDNQLKLFKPYKDLCARISALIYACNPSYPYPNTLATTIIEMSHSLSFYRKNLPSLTDFGQDSDDKEIAAFIEDLVFGRIKA